MSEFWKAFAVFWETVPYFMGFLVGATTLITVVIATIFLLHKVCAYAEKLGARAGEKWVARRRSHK